MGMTERLAVIKCYLNLFHSVLNVSYDTILKLEQTDLVPTEVYDMMNSLESKLQWSIDSKLLGYKRSSSKNTSLQEQCEGFYSVIYVCSHFWFHILITANKIIFTLDSHFLWGEKKDFTTTAEELQFYEKLNWDCLMRNIVYIIRYKVKWRVCVDVLQKPWIWTWCIYLSSEFWFFQFLIVHGINYAHFYLKCRSGTNNFLG